MRKYKVCLCDRNQDFVKKNAEISKSRYQSFNITNNHQSLNITSSSPQILPNFILKSENAQSRFFDETRLVVQTRAV